MKVLALVLVATFTATTTPASATPAEFSFGDAGYHLLNSRWMAVSPLIGGGASQLGVTREGMEPSVVGLRYTERKGFVTGLFFALINSLAGGMAANSPKSVTSYQSGNYIITETVYRSEAERQAMLQQTAEASAAMMEAENQAVELEIYSRNLPGGSETSGYKLNMYFGMPFNDYFSVDVGLGWGSVDSRMERDGRQGYVHLSYFGMPLKVNVAAGPLLIYFHWEWNWLGEWTEHTPDTVDEADRFKQRSTRSHLELGLQTVLFERLLLQAGLTTPALPSADFGYRASVGFRF